LYLPSFVTVARALGAPANIARESPGAAIPVDARALRLLLQFVALAADYDEATYLKHNPDIAEAHEAGRIANLRQHFVESGYFEGRKASSVNLDGDWYLQMYPDVGESVREGIIASAQAHFALRGEIECRSPNCESLPWVSAFAELLSRAAPPSSER